MDATHDTTRRADRRARAAHGTVDDVGVGPRNGVERTTSGATHEVRYESVVEPTIRQNLRLDRLDLLLRVHRHRTGDTDEPDDDGNGHQHVLVVVGPRAVDVRLAMLDDRLEPTLEEVHVLRERQLQQSAENGQDRQYDEREEHDLRALVWLEIAVRTVLFAVVVPTGLAEEHHDDLTRHVVRGEQCGDETDHVETTVVREDEQENFVLRPETGKGWHAGNGQPADDEREGRDGHQLAKCTHATHVLFMVHAVDDRTRTEEQQRLEESVRHHVEDCCDVRARPDGKEHVAELRHRGIREHLLDIGLCNGNGRGEQSGCSTDDRDDCWCPRVGLVNDRVHAGHEEHACGDHRCSVDECRNRCGAFHRVGQPEVERQLRALATCTDEQHQRNCGGRDVAQRASDGCRIDAFVRQRSHRREREEHRRHDAPVTDAVRHERLLAGRGCAVTCVPERDQEVRAGTHAFPTEEGDQKVLAQNQHEHRKDEEVEVDEELRELRITVHVTHCVQMDQRADSRDEQRHCDRQRIGEERHLHLQRTHRDPGKEAHHVRTLFCVLRQHVEERERGNDERSATHRGSEEPGLRFAESATEQNENQKAREWQGGNQPDDIEHVTNPSALTGRRRSPAGDAA